jgi:hypothetical protein
VLIEGRVQGPDHAWHSRIPIVLNKFLNNLGGSSILEVHVSSPSDVGNM